ncbi:MAG: hypothetical protein ACERK6_06675 [Candidatus Aminicenantaceae bacterium]
MKKTWGLWIVLLLVLTSTGLGEKSSTELEHLTWIEAEKALAEYDVVLIALGCRRDC